MTVFLPRFLPTRWPKLIAAGYTKKGYKAVLPRFALLDLNPESRGRWKVFRKDRCKTFTEK